MRGSRWGGDQSDRPRRGRWSVGEVARLKELYGLKDDEAIAKDLGRPVSSVKRMARTLFPGTLREGPWSEEEIQNLKRYIGVANEEIIGRILGRTPAEVKAQIESLSQIHVEREWSQQEIAELKRLYGTRVDEDIARIFGRTPADVTAKAHELCLAKDKAFVRKLAGTASTRMPRWSKEEIQRLEELYPVHSNLEIAKLLDRSVKSVVSKAHNLGLRKDRQRLAEMGRQNVSLRYGRRKDGTKDPDIESEAPRAQSAGASAISGEAPAPAPAPEPPADSSTDEEPPGSEA